MYRNLSTALNFEFTYHIVFLAITLTSDMYCFMKWYSLLSWFECKNIRGKHRELWPKCYYSNQSRFGLCFFKFLSFILILYLLFLLFEFKKANLVSIATSWATRISSLYFVEIKVQGTVLISWHFRLVCADLPSNTHTMWQFEKDAWFWSCIVIRLLVVSAPSPVL